MSAPRPSLHAYRMRKVRRIGQEFTSGGKPVLPGPKAVTPIVLHFGPAPAPHLVPLHFGPSTAVAAKPPIPTPNAPLILPSLVEAPAPPEPAAPSGGGGGGSPCPTCWPWWYILIAVAAGGLVGYWAKDQKKKRRAA